MSAVRTAVYFYAHGLEVKVLANPVNPLDQATPAADLLERYHPDQTGREFPRMKEELARLHSDGFELLGWTFIMVEPGNASEWLPLDAKVLHVRKP